MSPIDERYEFACTTVRQAGALALDYFRRFETLEVKSKGVQDMASEADIESQNLIEAAISRAYPEDAFLGEENPDAFRPEAGKGTWIIDPVDGTQPFVNGIPSWCVSIAYVMGTEFKIGVVFDPVNDELFAAVAGKGATLNGRPITASKAGSLADGLVSVGFSNRVTPDDTLLPLGRLMHAKGMYHRSGSGALSLAYVAAGRLIGYFEPHMNSWDFAASALIVKEAGGVINDCLPNDAALIKGSLVLAAAPGVFPALSDVVFGAGEAT
jgi:myo-inositol-1(or 4)-monophosphatase